MERAMTTIKKNVKRRAQRVRGRGRPSADPYRELLPPRSTAHCSQCGAVYRHQRWKRMGRALERAFHGKATYQWSRENKLLRVQRAQEAAPA